MAITAQQQQRGRVPSEHHAEWMAQQQGRKHIAVQQPAEQPVQTPGRNGPSPGTWKPAPEKKPRENPMKH